MRGDLVEKSAADVCRELAVQGASGTLAIDGPGGPGRVVLVDGRIIAAVSPTPRARLGDRLVGAGELDPDDLANALAEQQDGTESLPLGSLLAERGLVRRDAVRVFVQEQILDALFEVVRWRYGAFTFEPDDGARGQGVPLSLSVDDALVEVARRQQEWNELSQVIPDLDSVPSFRTGGATATAALEPDEFAVLASVDGTRSVRALAADLGYGEFEAARIIYGLSLLGVVDVRPPQDEIGAALEDALGLAEFEQWPSDEPPSPPDPAPQPDAADPLTAADQPIAADSADAGLDGEAFPEFEAFDAIDEGLEQPAPIDGPGEPTDPAYDGLEPPDPDDDSDQPDVWVSSPDDREPPPTDGQVIDAEVELTPEGAAPETAPPEDAPSWTDLAAAAEQAASDPESTKEVFGSPPERTGPTAAPTTGPEPGSEAPPSTDTPPSKERSIQARDSDTADSEGRAGSDPRNEASRVERPTAGTPQRGDDNDVSEFLRELSRLSVDPPSGPPRPPPPSRPPSPPPSGDQDSKKKRRGLFGRG